jgi:hypothetical protein
MEYGLYDKLDFGQYAGRTIKYVIDDDPDYIDWARDTIPGFELGEDASYYWASSDSEREDLSEPDDW